MQEDRFSIEDLKDGSATVMKMWRDISETVSPLRVALVSALARLVPRRPINLLGLRPLTIAARLMRGISQGLLYLWQGNQDPEVLVANMMENARNDKRMTKSRVKDKAQDMSKNIAAFEFEVSLCTGREDALGRNGLRKMHGVIAGGGGLPAAA